MARCSPTVRLLAAVGPVVAAVPWQALGRRLGLPFRRPSAREVVTAVPATVAAAAVSAVVVQRLAGSVAGVDRRAPVGGGRRAAVVGADPFPVLGPYASAAAAVAATRSAARSAATPAARMRAVAAAAVLVAGRHALYRVLDAALSASGPPPPPPPGPDLALNVGPTSRRGRAPDGFVVYFDGVGRATPRTTPVGRQFAEAIHRRLPTWTVVMSLMPNDVTQRPAWQRPVTGPLWRHLGQHDRGWLIARGIWEGIVAVDRRYQRRLMAGHTVAVLAHALAAGYRPGSGAPIVLVALSAGAQTALHVASDVARALGGAPLDVVTLGGFADGGADLSGVRRVHAAVSWGDPAELAAVPFLPSRWTALHVGGWSRARRARKVVVHRVDYTTHVGRTGYLGRAVTADGRTRLDQSADLVAHAARELTRHPQGGAARNRGREPSPPRPSGGPLRRHEPGETSAGDP
ncbi:MAG: hypothetical protein ACFCVF_01395 [Kineosporiaceae bacterium]